MRSRVAAVVAVGLLGAIATPGSAAAPLSFSRPIPVKPAGLTAIRSWGGASCPSSRLCIATDGTPRILTSTNPTGGRRAWTLGAIGHSGDITTISCPTTSMCVASGADELVDGFYVSTDPAGGAATWSFGGVAFGSQISSVSCPSVALCVAVDQSGDVMTSADPAGGAGTWGIFAIDPRATFLGVSCPSVSLCVAVDLYGAIYSSTDPTAGPGAWHRMLRRGHHRGWFGVDCPTVRLCVATGTGFETSTRPDRPGSWHHAPEPRTDEPFRDDVTGISCASVRLCVGADTGGLVFVSTDPTGGIRAWQVIRVRRRAGVGAEVRVACSRGRASVCAVAATAAEWLVVGHTRSHRRHPRSHRRRRRR